MSIDPTKPNPAAGTGAGRVHRPKPQTPVSREETTAADAPRTGRDAVELSAAARELLKQLGVESGSLSELPADRVQQVLSRLTSGHYDQPEVMLEVLRRLKGDL